MNKRINKYLSKRVRFDETVMLADKPTTGDWLISMGVVSPFHEKPPKNNSILCIIDVSTLSDPNESGFFDTGGDAWGGAVSGSYAYVALHLTGNSLVLIARVFEKWIGRGDMTIKDAKAVATDIMLRNGCRFHNLTE